MAYIPYEYILEKTTRYILQDMEEYHEMTLQCFLLVQTMYKKHDESQLQSLTHCEAYHPLFRAFKRSLLTWISCFLSNQKSLARAF